MPLYLRTAIAATVAGVAGLLVWAFSAQFIGSSSNARLRDTMPMVGSAMMSVCSLMFMISAVLAIVHAARGRKFSWTHGHFVAIAGCVTFAAGIAGAYPR